MRRSKVVPLPVCVTRVTQTGYRWFCWRCGSASPKLHRQDKVIRELDRHVNDYHGPIGYDPFVPPMTR